MNPFFTNDLHARAVAAFQQRKWRHAFDLSVQLLQMTSNHAGACHIAGAAALELQLWSQALSYLRQAVQLDAGRADSAALFAKALSLANMHEEAVRAADRAMWLSPADPVTLDTLGVVYSRSNLHERAANVFRSAATKWPDISRFRFNHAMALMYSGDMDAAEAETEACLLLDPRHWRAHFSLSRLRDQTPASNHLQRLHSLAQETIGDAIAQMYLHMALGKEYEDLGEYAKAFSHFTTGKSAIRGTSEGSVARDKAVFEAVTLAFPEPRPQPAGCLSDEPIFVMGMPRSGTTLVERIISSHPFVQSAGELQNFGLELKRISGVRTPTLLDVDTIARSHDMPWAQLGEAYISSTRPITQCKPHFVDKLPHNFLYLGYILKALPNARIICLRRNPLDTCLSNFREVFTPGSESHNYSHDLLDTGRYYIQFDRLMAHWKRVFPDRFLELQYETLVDAQEASTRQLLAYCDLPWNDACLRFERNRSPETSASAVQVREPIYRNAVERWRKYDTELVALRDLLEGADIDCG